MITMVRLLTICHHTKILTTLPTLYISYPRLIYFVTESLYLLLSLTYFSPPPSPRKPTLCSLYLWLCFCLVMFVHLFFFFFLDSTYNCNHAVFVSEFLFLSYFFALFPCDLMTIFSVMFGFFACIYYKSFDLWLPWGLYITIYNI